MASSEATAELLRGHGIEVFDLNNVDGMDIYVDGADEITEHLHMLKGGGGALLIVRGSSLAFSSLLSARRSSASNPAFLALANCSLRFNASILCVMR